LPASFAIAGELASQERKNTVLRELGNSSIFSTELQ